MSELARKTKSALQWSAIERILSQGVQLGVSLYLARLVGPTAFGLVGMLAIFIAISNVFVDGGVSSALIRKRDHTKTDLTTAFYYNIFTSSLCYIILYVGAPYVADFYGQEELQKILRVLGVVVLLNSFTLIPRIQLIVAIDFRTQAKVSLTSVAVSGSCAIVLANNGWGVWSLVWQTIINAICSVLLLSYFVPWRPYGKISRAAFNYLFGFGSKLLLSGLLDVCYSNLYQIIIGKQFSPSLVGQFTQSNQLASAPAMTLTSIVQRVTYPMLSRIQDDTSKMDYAYRITLKMSAMVIFPLILWLGLVAKPLLTVVLGGQWSPAATLLSVLCIGHMLYPIHSINLNLLQVKGHSDIFLKLEVIKKMIGVSILFASIPYGVFAMCVGLSVTSYIALLLNTYYTAKLTSISQWQQCKYLLPIWSAVLFSAAVAYMVGYNLQATPWLQILINLTVALIVYMLCLFVFEKPLLLELRSALHS